MKEALVLIIAAWDHAPELTPPGTRESAKEPKTTLKGNKANEEDK
jgi:hypothetical protein